MAANDIRAYCAELSHAATTTTGAADEIDGLRGKLGRQLDDLAHTWTGQAATAYLDIWAEIDEECGAMLADLRWIGESLSAAADAYARMEGYAANAFRGIRPSGPSDGL
jgi:WXG100 family type VII secretion target